MGKGQDKIARNLMDLQPTAIVEMFRLFFNTVDSPGKYVSFHGGSLFGNDILWQDIPYSPIPVETEGFEINGNGQVPRPKIRVANKDYFITKLLTDNNDFLHAKLIRKRTFVKYLDDKNFDGGNPWGEADSSAELSNDTFLFSQKTAENKSFVEFELTSPLDMEGFDLNNRLVLSRYCPWRYRGAGCNYAGPPIETEDLQPIEIFGTEFEPLFNSPGTINPTIAAEWAIGREYKSGNLALITHSGIQLDPLDAMGLTQYYKDWFSCRVDHTASAENKPYGTNTFWLKDGCSKRLSACRKRFGNVGTNGKEKTVSYTRNYVDFSALYKNPSNNIASVWNRISGFPDQQTGDNPSLYHPFFSAVDGNINSLNNPYSTYWSATTAATGVFYINDLTGRFDQLDSVDIDRINVYNVYRNNKFGTGAKISITNSAGAVTSIISPQIVDGATTGRFTLTGSFLNTSGVSISGIGGTGIPTLDQIEILDYRRNRGLISYNFTQEKIHQNENFLIGMWLEFPNGNTSDTRKINLVHNIKTGCQHSGFNVYLAGSDLICDFAVVSVSGHPIPTSTIIKRSITGNGANYIFNGRNCLFLENYQQSGHSTGQPLSRIRLLDEYGESLCDYHMPPKNTGTKFSGEYFLFKDPTKQNGIGNLSFGINEWEDYKQGLVYTSPIKWGSIAIWEKDGSYSDLIYRNFGRNGNQAKEEFYSFQSLKDKNTLKEDLFAWWDSDLNIPSGIPAYITSVTGRSGDSNIFYNLTLTGSAYTSLLQQKEVTIKIFNESDISVPTPENPLPFGGFPGTDKYGN